MRIFFSASISIYNAIFTRTPEGIRRDLHFYDGILKYIPSLRSELDTMSLHRLTQITEAVRICAYILYAYDEWRPFINQIVKGMSDGRSVDLLSVKHKAMKYISTALPDLPIPKIEDNCVHRIFHPQQARFLCPRMHLEEYDEDWNAWVDLYMAFQP